LPWEPTTDAYLRQGELLRSCWLPRLDEDAFAAEPGSTVGVEICALDVIVLTQSCDLLPNGGKLPRAKLVTLCPVYPLREWVDINPDFKKPDKCESLRRGRVEGLHLLPAPEAPNENAAALVADFRNVRSAPLESVSPQALRQSHRWRLRSPYLEHFSQAFGRFFMRVGLPIELPKFQ
jgi:hypothetical protein